MTYFTNELLYPSFFILKFILTTQHGSTLKLYSLFYKANAILKFYTFSKAGINVTHTVLSKQWMKTYANIHLMYATLQATVYDFCVIIHCIWISQLTANYKLINSHPCIIWARKHPLTVSWKSQVLPNKKYVLILPQWLQSNKSFWKNTVPEKKVNV